VNRLDGSRAPAGSFLRRRLGVGRPTRIYWRSSTAVRACATSVRSRLRRRPRPAL